MDFTQLLHLLSSFRPQVKVASWSCAAATACWWAPRPATLGTDRVAGGGSERVERVLKMMVLISVTHPFDNPHGGGFYIQANLHLLDLLE